MSFYFREPEVLFLGDYDLSKFGPWYGDRDSDVEDVMSSVEKLRKIPVAVWISCHETGLFEKEPGQLWDSYLGVIQMRDDKILALLSTPKTLSQIADAGLVYRKPGTTDSVTVFNKEATVKKHVELGLRRGIIRKDGKGYILASV